MSTHTPQPSMRLRHPRWALNGVLYQINVRQFTAAGTLAAAIAELPRLKALGATIIWLMPIHPIGERKRKGPLGSPYAVRDYGAVNPEFGTLADLKTFVAAAHDLGLRVILDWVANHTAWDHPLTESHPEWYQRDWAGRFRPTPWWDWTDIINLDYQHTGLREFMSAALSFWVREADVDGFRCDVAGMVPTDFWETVRVELEAIKPVFMLAEWESRELHARAFDATYAWSWYDAVQALSSQHGALDKVYEYYSWNECAYPRDAYRMTFVENHDKNAWDGTQFEQFGPALETAIVLSCLGEGIPLIHNGQEAGNKKRLAFFERDPIAWREHRIGHLYTRLLAFRSRHSVLWNGAAGASMVPVTTNRREEVMAFVRGEGPERILVTLNFSADRQTFELQDGPIEGHWTDVFADQGTADLVLGTMLDLPPWGWQVWQSA